MVGEFKANLAIFLVVDLKIVIINSHCDMLDYHQMVIEKIL